METVFELTGGAVCLDFANTADHRLAPEGAQEKLLSYDDLLAWGRQAGIVSDAVARGLAKRVAQEPAKERALLQRVRELRQALFCIFSRKGGVREMEVLNRELEKIATNVKLQPSGNGYEWVWTGEADALERVLWPVLRSAVELLTSEDRKRVRICASKVCGWLFLDTSKNHSRRWCDMKVCGNRAKARRFYKRHQG